MIEISRECKCCNKHLVVITANYYSEEVSRELLYKVLEETLDEILDCFDDCEFDYELDQEVKNKRLELLRVLRKQSSNIELDIVRESINEW